VNREALCILQSTVHMYQYSVPCTCLPTLVHCSLLHCTCQCISFQIVPAMTTWETLYHIKRLLYTFVVLFTANVGGYPKQQTAGQGEEYIE